MKNKSESKVRNLFPVSASGGNPLPVTTVETVTPETAAEWLKTNVNNRNVKTGVVEKYAAQMKAGLWTLTHQGIGFGADGRLYDGQHRLLAVIKSGVSIQTNVTRGLPPKALDATDNGTVRRSYDTLAITDGVRFSTNVRASIVAAYNLAKDGSLLWTRSRSDVHELRRAVAEHGDDVKTIFEALASKHDVLSNAALVGALAIVHRTQPKKAVEFAELLRSGAGLVDGSPVLTLRNFITLKYESGGGKARDDLALRTFAAFDAFVRGANRTQSKCSETARTRYLAPWRKEGEIR